MMALQITLPLEQVHRPPVNVADLSLTWRGYTGNATDEQVRALFEQRMGYAPDVVWRPYPHMVLAGPVREKKL
jgi:hypothetical protein